MQAFTLSSGVVIPLMIYMLIGFFIRTAGIFSRENFKALNQMLFRILIPLSLFNSIRGSDFSSVADIRLVIITEGLLIGSCVFLWYALKRPVPEVRDRSTLVQGCFRANTVLIGGVIASALCDEAGTALIAALTALVVPTINIESVVLFELAGGRKIRPLDLLGRIIKNPIVFAGIIGILFSLLKLKLPGVIETPIRSLGNAATPMGLVALGGVLSFGSIRRHLPLLGLASLIKLVLMPLAALAIVIPLGYRGGAIAAMLAVFASPTAVASAPMAQAMGGNGDLASEIVAATSVLSLLTLFGLISMLARFL